MMKKMNEIEIEVYVRTYLCTSQLETAYRDIGVMLMSLDWS